MPPAPIGARISYGPNFVPAASVICPVLSPLTVSLRRLGDPQRRVDPGFLDDRFPAGRPEHLDALDRGGAAQAEVQRQRALREVAGFPVVDLRLRPAAGRDTD